MRISDYLNNANPVFLKNSLKSLMVKESTPEAQLWHISGLIKAAHKMLFEQQRPIQWYEPNYGDTPEQVLTQKLECYNAILDALKEKLTNTKNAPDKPTEPLIKQISSIKDATLAEIKRNSQQLELNLLKFQSKTASTGPETNQLKKKTKPGSFIKRIFYWLKNKLSNNRHKVIEVPFNGFDNLAPGQKTMVPTSHNTHIGEDEKPIEAKIIKEISALQQAPISAMNAGLSTMDMFSELQVDGTAVIVPAADNDDLDNSTTTTDIPTTQSQSPEQECRTASLTTASPAA